ELGVGREVGLDTHRLAGPQPELQVHVDELDQETLPRVSVGAQIVGDGGRLSLPPGILERLDQPLAVRPARAGQQFEVFRVVEPGSSHSPGTSPGLRAVGEDFPWTVGKDRPPWRSGFRRSYASASRILSSWIRTRSRNRLTERVARPN